MPYPLHNHVAQAYLTIIDSSRFLSESQRSSILNLIKTLPARVTIYLLSQAGHHFHSWIDTEDGMIVDTNFAELGVSIQDRLHYFIILNHIRISLGLSSWLPTPSHMMDSVSNVLQTMYEHEINDGILPDDREYLYELTSTLVDSYLNTSHDTNLETDDTSTILTEPIQDTFQELDEILDQPNNLAPS